MTGARTALSSTHATRAVPGALAFLAPELFHQ